jgi:hypothetical protein
MAADLASLQKQFQDISNNMMQQSTSHPNDNIVVTTGEPAVTQHEGCRHRQQPQQTHRQQQSASTHQQSSYGSDDFDTAVCKAVQDLTRWKQNVIISRVPEDPSVSDWETVLQLCSNYLPIKPLISEKDCIRIGKPATGKPRRLLVRLRSENAVRELLQSAPLLRSATDKAVAGAVFIKPDLSPAESKKAYEKRKMRREERQQSHGNVGSISQADNRGAIDNLQLKPASPHCCTTDTVNISPFRL